jgi:hypothetical protein
VPPSPETKWTRWQAVELLFNRLVLGDGSHHQFSQKISSREIGLTHAIGSDHVISKVGKKIWIHTELSLFFAE